MQQTRGRPVQFCATCVFLERVPTPDGRGAYRCSRLGYRTSPRYVFSCWTPRPAYAWATEGARDGEEGHDAGRP